MTLIVKLCVKVIIMLSYSSNFHLISHHESLNPFSTKFDRNSYNYNGKLYNINN